MLLNHDKNVDIFILTTNIVARKKRERVADYVARKNRNVYNALSGQPRLAFYCTRHLFQNTKCVYQLLHLCFLRVPPAYCAPIKNTIILFFCKKVKVFYSTWYGTWYALKKNEHKNIRMCMLKQDGKWCEPTAVAAIRTVFLGLLCPFRQPVKPRYGASVSTISLSNGISFTWEARYNTKHVNKQVPNSKASVRFA